MGFRRAVVLVITSLALMSAAVPTGAANAATLTLPTVSESPPPRSAAADAQPGAWAQAAVHPVITSIGPDEGFCWHWEHGLDQRLWIRRTDRQGEGAVSLQPKRGKSPAQYISANNITFWSDTDIWREVPVDNNGYPRSAASGPLTVTDANGVKSEPIGFAVTFGYWHRLQKPEYRFLVSTNNKGWLKMTKAAGKTWTDTDQFSFIYSSKKATKPRLGNAVNEIYWGKVSSKQTLAETRTRTPPGSKFPTEADIVFNKDLSWGSSMPFKFDVQTIALHEMGHVVGLRDLYGADDKQKVMYGMANMIGPQGWTWGRHRNLTADDIAGASWIRKQYPSDGGDFPRLHFFRVHRAPRHFR